MTSVRYQVWRALVERRATSLGPPLPYSSPDLAALLNLDLRAVEEALSGLYGLGWITLDYSSARRYEATATTEGIAAASQPLLPEKEAPDGENP